MKKTALLNSEISRLIASLGHQDLIVIADAGLPIPKEVQKIDLALTRGVPGFLETLETVLSELCVERAVMACELKHRGGPLYERVNALLKGTPIDEVSHEEFKSLMRKQAVAVIRTGECTPYANVILQSGVVF